MQYVKLPIERVAVLIGKGGETKEFIEKRTGAVLKIDSETGDVAIDTEHMTEPFLILKVVDVVKAIARGFSPERAFVLFSDDVYFESIDIRDQIGKSPDRMIQMRSRLIGTGGRTRGVIEDLTNTHVSIFGNTVSIIGEITALYTAKTAIDMILCGSEHATVYKFLERKRREAKLAALEVFDSEPVEE